MTTPASEGGSARTPLSRPWRVLSVLLAWLARAMVATYRVELAGPDPPEGRRLLFAFHHGHQMPLLRHPRPDRVVSLSSLSRDGEVQARVLRALGFEVVRGSSSRAGAEGLLALVRRIRDGASAALAVDGPRGPAGSVKPGIAFLARATGAVIVPIAVAARRVIVLGRSWDRFQIPLPWSRVVLLRGEVIEVPRGSDDAVMDQARGQLEGVLERLAESAATYFDGGTREREKCLESPR